MKKIYLMIIAALGINASFFTQNCTTPIANSLFQQRLNQINSIFDATA